MGIKQRRLIPVSAVFLCPGDYLGLFLWRFHQAQLNGSGYYFDPFGDIQFFSDLFHMISHCVFADMKLISRFPVGEALGYQS